MEPRLPSPTPSPEMGGYHQTEKPKPMEARPSRERQEVLPGGERHEVRQPAQAAAPVAPPMPILPVPQSPKVQTAQQSSPVGDTPLSAADDDLIEREWVDKAKRIVRDTRSDPYQQEDEVSKLQADYLKKRYGKDIGTGN